MLEFSRWKYLLIFVIVALSVLYALPNLFPQDLAVQISAQRGASVDTALKERVQGILEAQSLPFKRIEIDGDSLLVRTDTSDHQLAASDTLRDELGSDYVVAVNLASTVPEWLAALGGKPMLLGLDLRGGVYFKMEVDLDATMLKRENGFADEIRAMLRDKQIGYTGVTRSDKGISVQLRSADDVSRAEAIIRSDLPQLEVVESSDMNLLAKIRPTELKTIVDSALEQNIGTLRNRINELGVAEPIIQREGATRIVVQLPGVQDTAQAKKILGSTATLEYRSVVDGDPYAALSSGNVPADARIYYRKERDGAGNRIPVLLSKKVIVSGNQLVNATSGMDPQGSGPEVNVTLDNIGASRMLDFTRENVGRGMAVVYIERTPEVQMVDGKEVRTTKVNEEVISVANIQGVFGKRFRTTGLESSDYAADLALLLRAGSLAAPVDIVEQRVIGPSLGAENVSRGLTAVIYSFMFALAFFLIYYRMFGVITCAALMINLLMVVALMSLLGFTLTLPGLAGIALTVGMSVDANVLINERIREELRGGMPPVSAIGTGYDKASGTIADANLTALLAGVALFVFGSGPVKGFAVALILGILTSMYTAVSVSRSIAALIYGRRRKLKSIAI